MDQLLDAFKGLFSEAVQSGGALARTANFALENVDWSAQLQEHRPQSHPVIADHLKTACALAGQSGSSTHRIAEALLAVTDRIGWHASSNGQNNEPDLEAFSRNYVAASIIGIGGLLPSDKVAAGFSLQGPDTYYPPHAHQAEESYWTIGGDGDWKIDRKPWFAVRPGDTNYHESWARHAMQTNEHPMLSVWLWTSHLESDVVFVRG